MSIDFAHLLSLAIEACNRATEEILEVYSSAAHEVSLKADTSPLTAADRRSHEVLSACLEASNFPVVSEEGQQVAFEDRKVWEYFWLIDPLDGTKEFVKKNGEFTVNVALIHRNEPVLGAVAVPVSGDLYFASKERGAFLRRNGTIYRLEQRAPADLGRSGLRVVASRSHMNEETHAFISTLKDPTLISVGSSLKFMAVATGEADLYPRFIPCMEWDTAAADIILREVGLGIIDNTSGNPLLYNKQTLLTNYFVCGGVAFSKT